ncbi:MAG: hypothetical protein AAF366_06540 [Pseudomonadota bacterium]
MAVAALTAVALATGPVGLAIAQSTSPGGLPQTLPQSEPEADEDDIAPNELPVPVTDDPRVDPRVAEPDAGDPDGPDDPDVTDTVDPVVETAFPEDFDPTVAPGSVLDPVAPSRVRPTAPPRNPSNRPAVLGSDDGAQPLPNPALIFDLGFGAQIEDADESAGRLTVGAIFQTETRVQSLSVDLGTALDFSGNGLQADDVFPDLSFDYERDTSVLILQLSGDYRIDDVEGSVPGPEFDFDESDVIDDDGTREVISGDAGVVFFPRGRAGLELGAFFRQSTFNDTEDPDLDDTERFGFDAALRYNISRTLTFRFTGSYREEEDGGVLDLEEEELRVGGRVTWAATPRTQVDLGLSFSNLDTTQNTTVVGLDEDGDIGLIATGGTESSTSDTVVGDLAVTHALKNGTVGLTASRNLTTSGDIDRVTLNRNFDLPGDARFGISLGVADFEGGDTVVVGDLRYSKPIVRGGELSFSVRRDADVDGDLQDVVRTRATLTHVQELTPVSTLAINVGASEINVVDGFEDDDVSANIGVTYSRAVTRDWALALGYRGSAEIDDDEDTTTNGELFLTLNRRFAFRPY